MGFKLCKCFSSKLIQIIISVCVFCWIVFLYRWTNTTSFTKINKQIYSAESKKNFKFGENTERNSRLNKAGIVSNGEKKVPISFHNGEVKNNSVSSSEEIDILITFTNAKTKHDLQTKFKTTVSSLFKYSSVSMTIYIIGDKDSQLIAESILKEERHASVYRMVKLDIDPLIKKLDDIVKEMQKYFSDSQHSYFGQSLFFLSIAIHKALPLDLHKVIMLDSDLKFNADIKYLYELFSHFSTDNIIGIAHDAQPVYRHTFSSYRSQNPGTRVGEPSPDGLTGFNSGVLLLDLDRMRKSALYNSLLNPNIIKNLTEKYQFKGHLGDQDLFTLLSLDYEKLFYVLPCSWNRQLCVWWRDNGYKEVFDLYFKCEGKINIYHGNCNTPIPD
ncbi:xyloside xylosyltransferase 1 isoform X1 [Patella vulgata]|uniref:xyloside xylosyltransferase 1 isoform X1 n=1 Tax=Patella vulgata TaxID=6465 RepID=UPI00217FB4A6|nr:xyloside xylosyltransferase 1 isoform X1 [Patella vulgata]